MGMTKSEVEQLRGSDLYSSDGDSIGTVDTVFYDRDTGAPEWLGVKRGLISPKWKVVPLANVTVEGNELRLPYTTAQIDNAPEVAGKEITDSEEDALYDHYGLPRSTARSGSGLPGGASPTSPGAEPVQRPSAPAPATSREQSRSSTRPSSRPSGRPSSRSTRTTSRSSSKKKRTAYHVTPDEDGWKVVKEGQRQPLFGGRKKDDVIPRARRQAKKDEAQLIIHKKDGKIQEERTYGPDPVSSKG
jgi:hypothetical protein